MIDPLPHPVFLPFGEIIEDDAIWRKVVRQPSPRASLANEIENRIEDITLLIPRWTAQLAAGWKQFANDAPFMVFQVARVRFVLCHPKFSILSGDFCTVKSLGGCRFLDNWTFWTGSKISPKRGRVSMPISRCGKGVTRRDNLGGIGVIKACKIKGTYPTVLEELPK